MLCAHIYRYLCLTPLSLTPFCSVINIISLSYIPSASNSLGCLGINEGAIVVVVVVVVALNSDLSTCAKAY